MVKSLWGKKVGMTQLFVDSKAIPVTVIDTGNWLVKQIKTQENDGYNAVQVACVKKRYADQAVADAWFKRPKQYFSAVKEIRLDNDAVVPDTVRIGKPVDITSLFAENDAVDVAGTSIGRGFAGVVKRHGFSGGPKSHGSTIGRVPGSIGFFTSQGRVIKGKKLPGHMGSERVTVENLRVIKVDADNNTLIVSGSVPGKVGSLVCVRKRR